MRDDRARLMAKKARIEEQLAQLAKADAIKREQDQKRRTLLAGRIVLDRATKDEEFGRVLMAILDQAITAPRDRALFAFSEPVPRIDAETAAKIPAAEQSPGDVADTQV